MNIMTIGPRGTSCRDAKITHSSQICLHPRRCKMGLIILSLTLPMLGLVASPATNRAASQNAAAGSEVGKTVAQPPPKKSFIDPIEGFVRNSILRPTVPFELIPGKDPNGWQFVIEPYLWAIGLSGITGVGELPAVDVNVSSSKLLQNFDWGLMAQGEIRKGRWGLLADGYYAELSGSGDLGGVLYRSGTMEVQQGLASLSLAYRVIDDRRGFLDVYAGARYNYLGAQIETEVDPAGISSFSTGVTERVAQQIDRQVSAAVQAVRTEVLSAVQVAKQSLDANVAADVSFLASRVTEDVRTRLQSRVLEAVADEVKTRLDARVLGDLQDRGLGQRGLRDRSDRELRRSGIDPRRVEHLRRFYTDLRTVENIETVFNGSRRQRSRGALVEYLRASVDLEIARLRGEATSDLENRANAAKAKASKELAAGIEEALPTEGAGDAWWVDPLIGLRGQINFTRWLFLAAQGDVGGFGAGSQITWNVQATIGVNFTRNVFAELGYRYMYVDYQSGGLLYEMNSYGLFSSLGIKF